MEAQILILLTVLCVTQASFKTDIVKEHNAKRKLEPAKKMPNLVWDPKLAKLGQKWAEKCKFGHGQPSGAKGMGHIGQNLYASWGMDASVIGKTATDSWYKEKSDYTFSTKECTKGKMCGHYTQVVWADTTKVGCGYQHCSDGMDFVVCNYQPAGNFNGRDPYVKS